jgi:hypothetical protein
MAVFARCPCCSPTAFPITHALICAALFLGGFDPSARAADPVARPALTVTREAPFTASIPTVVNIFGIGYTPSPSVITGTPPDPTGAVGPNHYVQAVNGGLAIWDKSGTLLWGPQLLNVLWTGYVGTNAGNQCATRNDGDPVVLYDKAADRWVISQVSSPNNTGPDYQCVAVSKTSDPTPTAGYWLYDFQYPFFNSDAKMGVWPDGYYVTFNDLYHKYGGADLCVYNRSAMLAGAATTPPQQCFQQPVAVSGVLPADWDGGRPPPAGSPGYFMNYGTNSLNLWALQVDWAITANTVLSSPVSIPVNAFTPACNGGICIPQPNGTKVDSVANRLMPRLAYRNFGDHESLVVSHSVALNNVSGVRWYEIRSPGSAPVVHQQGTYEPGDGNWRWMPSIAMDASGNIAIGFSVSSATTNPSIAYTARLTTDPLGTMGQGETTIASGTAGESGASRWGDYSSMTVDPVDDCTFWYTNEYYLTEGATTWDTRIASFTLGPTNCQKQHNTTTALVTVCPTTFVENQSIALTATVSGSSPTGTVTFQEGSTQFCNNVSLMTGNAVCQTPALMVQGSGTSYVYNATANYGGDSLNNPSSSPPLALTVLKASDVIFRQGFESNLGGCPTH